MEVWREGDMGRVGEGDWLLVIGFWIDGVHFTFWFLGSLQGFRMVYVLLKTHSLVPGPEAGASGPLQKNEPPRCCPVLCWVKTSCFTAKLAVLKKESAQGGTCTRTGGALDAVPLLLGYLSMDKIGHPAGICPRICRLKAGRPVCLDDRVKMMIRPLAEDGGLAPHATRWWHDPVSTGSRPAGPVRHPWSS